MELVTKFIKLRHLMLMVVLTTMSLFVVSCGGSDDDDVATVDAASVIASSYSGTLKPIGFSDAPAFPRKLFVWIDYSVKNLM